MTPDEQAEAVFEAMHRFLRRCGEGVEIAEVMDYGIVYCGEFFDMREHSHWGAYLDGPACCQACFDINSTK